VLGDVNRRRGLPALAKPATSTVASPSLPDLGNLDALVVVAFTWNLEIACEICLCEVEEGRRVGFVYLDITNADEFPLDRVTASANYALTHRYRLAKVEACEELLRSRGVTVITIAAPHPEVVVSSRRLGIDSTESLRDFRSSGAALGIGVLSSLIHRTGDSDPDVTAQRRLVDRLLTSACQAFDITTELIRELAPATVYVYNGRLACLKAIAEAARLANVDLRYYEIGQSPARFYCADRPPQSAENGREMLRRSWEKADDTRWAMAQLYFADDRGGVPLIDRRYRQQQEAGQSIPPSCRRRIVYFVSSIDEFAAVEDGCEHPVFDSQRSAVEWLVDWVRARPDTELVIRVHPRMFRLSRRERRWWSSHSADNVIILPAESAVDSHALAASAHRVVCYHSSLAVDATYMGIVSMLVGDADYRGLDCVYEPRTVEEFEEMLEDPVLKPKPRENCLPYGYSRLTWGTPFRFCAPGSDAARAILGGTVSPSRVPLATRAGLRALRSIDSLVHSVRSRFRR
jgi:hypothetical protein